MLSRFSVKNFKSIGEKGVALELKPLTILVGPNGSGKSSILHALAVICQSLRQGQPRHDAELIKFSSIEDLIHKNEIERWLNFELMLAEDGHPGFIYEWRHDTGESKQTIIKDKKNLISVELIGNRREGFDVISKLSDDKKQSRGRIDPSGALAILDRYLFRKDWWPETWLEFEEAERLSISIFEKLNKKVFFISANRGKIPFQAQTGEVSESYFWVGSEGERLVPLLSVLTSPLYEEIRHHILNWSERFGLLKLSAGVRGPNLLRAEYKDDILNVSLNLALASKGSRQILSIITQLFWSPIKSVVMIEEPEISLHPEKQIEIIRLFADAIKSNKQQIIISTHSHFLQVALGLIVQEGLLKVTDIALYEVKKDKEGTKASTVKLSERGFPLGWPTSFDKVEKMVAHEWLKGFGK